MRLLLSCCIATVLFALSVQPVAAQTQSKATVYNLTTIDGTLEALYGSISGEKGEERDWKTFRRLFVEGARLIPSGKNQQGELAHRVMTPEDYIEQSGPYLVQNGFFEEEIHRETDRFGQIAQVFSTYTSRNTQGGPLIARGINSIQLFHDGNRWWVVTIMWAGEREDLPIPKAYDAQ